MDDGSLEQKKSEMSSLTLDAESFVFRIMITTQVHDNAVYVKQIGVSDVHMHIRTWLHILEYVKLIADRRPSPHLSRCSCV